MTDHGLRVGVVGAGATGGYLAAALARAGHDVTLVAREASAKTIRAHGVEVVEPDGSRFTAAPTRVLEPGEPAQAVDLALFCVKTYDTTRAVEEVDNLVGEHGTVLCLQNGIANEDVLAARYGPERVLAGVMYVGSERVRPGVINQSTAARIILGPYDRARTDRDLSESAASLFLSAGIECTYDESVLEAKWQKWLFNCGLNPLTALARKKLGAILSTPPGLALFESLIGEAYAVAEASEAPVGDHTLGDVMATAHRMDIFSSMYEDLVAGRPIELDAFTGHVLRLARQTGVPASTTAVVHDLLAVLDHRSAAEGA